MSYLRKNEFALIAHRGGPELGPENTIKAFSESIKIYPDMIFELDVHVTRDNEIVVMHDPTIDRTTSGSGKVCDLTYSEIEKHDAGFHTPWKEQGIKAPLLKHVLEKFPHSRVTIEVKLPGYEKQIVDIVNKYAAQNRVVLSSFDHTALSNLRRLAPQLCSGCSRSEIKQMVFATRVGMAFVAPRRGNVFQIPIDHEGYQVFTQKFLKLAHKINKQVHVWTINEEPLMRQLILDGADGIITDKPTILYKLAKEYKKI